MPIASPPPVPGDGRRPVTVAAALGHAAILALVLAVLPSPAAAQADLEAANKALEAQIARLTPLLAAEPCAVRRALADSGPLAAAPLPALSSQARIEAATVMILVGEPESAMGTGFFVAPDLVVTNQHVVGTATRVIVVGKGLPRPLAGKVIAATAEGERDYAVVRIDAQGATAQALPLCPSVAKTDKVATWGFPGVISFDDPAFQKLLAGDQTAVPEVVYSEGVVNLVRETTPAAILHTAVTSKGNSGGPLLDSTGCVVGITTLLREDTDSYRQTSVALGAGDLAAYLRSQGIPAVIGR